MHRKGKEEKDNTNNKIPNLRQYVGHLGRSNDDKEVQNEAKNDDLKASQAFAKNHTVSKQYCGNSLPSTDCISEEKLMPIEVYSVIGM